MCFFCSSFTCLSALMVFFVDRSSTKIIRNLWNYCIFFFFLAVVPNRHIRFFPIHLCVCVCVFGRISVCRTHFSSRKLACIAFNYVPSSIKFVSPSLWTITVEAHTAHHCQIHNNNQLRILRSSSLSFSFSLTCSQIYR